ncbi:MSP domain protein [Cooperia oncophora]
MSKHFTAIILKQYPFFRDSRTSCTFVVCHLKSAVTISPRSAHFSAAGGLSIHNIKNVSKTRLAIKITCSDNTIYRVTPVYAILEPEEVVVLNIGRLDGVPKKDRLGILMIDYSGTGNAKDAFKRTDLRPVTVNVPLLVKEN